MTGVRDWLIGDPRQFLVGVIGNLTASAVCFLIGGRWVWKRHVRPHLDRVKDLHNDHFGGNT